MALTAARRRSDAMAPDKDQMTRRRREYLTVSEVAALFHVTPKTVVRWANDGRLPYMATLGGHRRFPRQHIESLVADLQRGSAQDDDAQPRQAQSTKNRA